MSSLRKIKGSGSLLSVIIPCVFLLAGCVKDDSDSKCFIELHAEGFTPDKSAKAAVAGDVTYWVNNDKVWINGGRFNVKIDDPEGRSASVQVEEAMISSSPISAIYPYEAYVGGRDREFTVHVPSEYTYRESTVLTGKKQILDGLPMVAFYPDKEPKVLEFKHLTAALAVQVKNEKSGDSTIVLDKIEVINSQFQLSGDVLVILNEGDPEILHDASHAIPYHQGEESKVTLRFVDVKPEIAPGEAKVFQIPILPVGSQPQSMFTIHVDSHCGGRRFTYDRSTPARDNSIARACIGYAVTKFTVSDPMRDLYDKVDVEEHPELAAYDGFYTINSPEELTSLVEAMNKKYPTAEDAEAAYHKSSYLVTQDIDLDGATIAPLHYYSEKCTFDGGEHTISNFTIDTRLQVDHQENLCGFFTEPEGKDITVCNLNLENVDFNFNHTNLQVLSYDQYHQTCVGGIFGCVRQPGIKIQNCHVRNLHMEVQSGLTAAEADKAQVDEYVGGIVGLCCESCIIEDCSVENVSIDNTMDASSAKVVDQFGAAIGRIDVGDKNTYQDKPNSCPVMVIKNFIYNQGANVLEFQSNLLNIRLGGVIANVTRGGKVFMEDIAVIHNAKVNPMASGGQMFVGGLIGCYKASKQWALHVHGNITVQGVINNNAFRSFSSTKRISRYCSPASDSYMSPAKKYDYDVYGNAEESLSYCTTQDNLFHVEGLTRDFHFPYQSFFAENRAATSDPRPNPSASKKNKKKK